MPVERLAVVRIVAAHAGAGVSQRQGAALEVRDADLAVELHRGERALVGDEVHHPRETPGAEKVVVGVDVDIFDQQGIIVENLAVVEHGDAVQQDQRASRQEIEVARPVRLPDLDAAAAVHPPDADSLDELREELLHHRESGVVVQDVPLALALVEDAVHPGGERGIERVRVEVLFQLHAQAPQFELTGPAGVQLQSGDVSGRQVQERAPELQVAGLPGFEALDLEEDFPVAIDIGGEEGHRPVRVDGFGIDALSGARRGDEGVSVCDLPGHALLADDVGADDFSFVFRHHAPVEAAGGRQVVDFADEVGDVLARRGGDAVVVADAQAEADGLRAVVGQADARGAGRGGAARLEAQRAAGRDRSRSGGRLCDHRHAALDALRAEGVEDGHGPDAGERIKSLLRGTQLGVGQEPVVAAGQGGGQGQETGAAPAVQGDLGRLDHAGRRMDLHVGRLAECGEPTRFGIQAPGGQPDPVAGHVDLPVGGEIDALAQSLRSLKGEQRQQQEKEI